MTITTIEDLDSPQPPREDEDGHRTYYTQHLITVDDANMTEADILSDPSMPVPHATTLAYDAAASCRSRRPTRLPSGLHWLLNATWSTRREAETEDSNPFLRPIKGGIRCVDKPVPVFADIYGIPAVNTAGDLYPGLTSVENTEVVEVTLYSTEWPSALRNFNNTVNSDVVTLFGEECPPRTLWMKNLILQDEPQEEYGVEFWMTTYEIHRDSAGYYRVLPNMGPHELQYYTRATTDDAFVPVDFDTYDAESTADLKKVEKQRISDDNGQGYSAESWLNRYGEAVIPTFGSGVVANASLTNGSANVTLDAAVLTDAHVGALLTFQQTASTPFASGSYSIRIKEVTNSTTAVIDLTYNGTNVSGIPVTLSGSEALFNTLKLQREAVWTNNVPLPPAPVVLGN